jgi:hypothetical protein
MVTSYMDMSWDIAYVTTIVCATSYDVFIYNVTTIYIMKPFKHNNS